MVGDVTLICRYAAALKAKLNTPLIKTAFSKLRITGCVRPKVTATANSPLSTANKAYTGVVAKEVMYTRSSTPAFKARCLTSTVSRAVVSDDQTPHAIPAFEVCPRASPDTPNTNPSVVIAHATRARAFGRELAKNTKDSRIVKGRSIPRAIW